MTEKEPYKPTPEEVSRAEALMSPTQKLPGHRESVYKEAQRLGIEGKDIPNIRLGSAFGESKMFGSIKGHEVLLKLNKENEYSGEIDGRKLESDQAKKMFERFRHLAFLNQEQYMDELKSGGKEQVEKEVQEMVVQEKKEAQSADLDEVLKKDFGI